jgi:hypothetical protein
MLYLHIKLYDRDIQTFSSWNTFGSWKSPNSKVPKFFKIDEEGGRRGNFTMFGAYRVWARGILRCPRMITILHLPLAAGTLLAHGRVQTPKFFKIEEGGEEGKILQCLEHVMFGHVACSAAFGR